MPNCPRTHCLRSLLLFTLFVFGLQAFSQNNEVIVAARPAWVAAVTPNLDFEPGSNESEDSYYLLLDFQSNAQKRTIYAHYVIKILNNQGIQNMSDLSFDFDPTYQSLMMHQLVVHRNGTATNRLPDSDFKTFQRESSMERYLYDGTLTAVVNLEDIREGDVIEYAYSINGSNPIYNGHYFKDIYLQYQVPVLNLQQRLLLPDSEQFYFKYYNEAPQPATQKIGSATEYLWDLQSVEAALMDKNVPSWYDPFPSISVSNYAEWGEVVDWALPLYEVSPEEAQRIAEKTAEIVAGDSREEEMLKAIRFVQDEVRYLGFESGLGAYQPRSPEKVLEQRFGDCKDKSLLLCSMLKSLEITAHPTLVSSYLTEGMENKLPSPGNFNHCVVHLEYGGEDFWVDPTASNQGGALHRNYFPNYGKALVIRPGEKELAALPTSDYSKTKVVETYTIDSLGGQVKLSILSEYTGDKADWQRYLFETSSLQTLRKNFEDYYSQMYSNIQMTKDLRYYDSHRTGANVFLVEESYTIDDFWNHSEEDSNQINCEVYPISLSELLSFPNSSQRTMPYYLSYPIDYEHEIHIMVPEEWNVESENLVIEGDAFTYSNTSSYSNREIVVHHQYKVLKPYLEPDEVDKFIKKQDEIRGQLSYMLYYNNAGNGVAETSTGAILFCLLILLACGFGAFQLYKKYDPDPAGDWQEKIPIGSWLILPAIGLGLTAIFSIIDLYNYPEFFDQSVWDSILNETGFAYNMELAVYSIYHMSTSIAFLIFNLMLMVLFLQRRSSTPSLMIIFYGCSLGLQVIATVLGHSFDLGFSEIELADLTNGIFKQAVFAGIWIPYFKIAERVKSTFVVTLKDAPVPEGHTEVYRMLK